MAHLTLPLEKCRALFASDVAMAQFADVLRQAVQETDTPVLTLNDEPIATALSMSATQSVLRDRILRKLAEQPALLERFTERLSTFQESDIVE